MVDALTILFSRCKSAKNYLVESLPSETSVWFNSRMGFKVRLVGVELNRRISFSHMNTAHLLHPTKIDSFHSLGCSVVRPTTNKTMSLWGFESGSNKSPSTPLLVTIRPDRLTDGTGWSRKKCQVLLKRRHLLPIFIFAACIPNGKGEVSE